MWTLNSKSFGHCKLFSKDVLEECRLQPLGGDLHFDVAIMLNDHGFPFTFSSLYLYFQPFMNYKHFSIGRNGRKSLSPAKERFIRFTQKVV